MKRVVLGLALVLLTLTAGAAVLTASLSWTTPTQHVDGTPITAALTYSAYQGVQGQPLNRITSGLTVNTLSVTSGLTPGTTQCWAVTATETGVGVEGGQSNQACVTVPLQPPSPPLAPTNLTVTLK